MKKEVKSDNVKSKVGTNKDEDLKQTKKTSEARPKKKVTKTSKATKSNKTESKTESKTSKKEEVTSNKSLNKSVAQKTTLVKKEKETKSKKAEIVDNPIKKTSPKKSISKSATKKATGSETEVTEKKTPKTTKAPKTKKPSSSSKKKIVEKADANKEVSSKSTENKSNTKKVQSSKKTSTNKKLVNKKETSTSKNLSEKPNNMAKQDVKSEEKPKNIRVKRTLIKSNNEAEDISSSRIDKKTEEKSKKSEKNKKTKDTTNKSIAQDNIKDKNLKKSFSKTSKKKVKEEKDSQKQIETKVEDKKKNEKNEKNSNAIENKKSTKKTKKSSETKTANKNKTEQQSEKRTESKSEKQANKSSNKKKATSNEQKLDSKNQNMRSKKATSQNKNVDRKEAQNENKSQNKSEHRSENKKKEGLKDNKADNRNKQNRDDRKDDRKDDTQNRSNKKDYNNKSNNGYSNKYGDRESKQKNNKPVKNVEELLIKPVLKNYRIRENEFVFKEINEDALITTSQKFNPTIKNTIKETQVFLRDKLFVDKMVVVVIAVSGGVDSVVLLDILANLSNSFMFELHIAHFDHGLRGKESEEDAEFVEELAKKYNIPFHKSKGKVKEHAKKYKKSIEEAARVLRYKFFEKVVLSVNAHFLATAHNANDSVETFLMNLIRGAGLTGLSGIPAKRGFIRNINLLRPILKLSKIEIREYAKQRKLEWREDSTNADNIFTRNRIRNELIPYLEKEFNPNIIKVIGRASSLVNYADRYITSNISSKIDSIIDFKDNNRVHINISMFMTFDEFIRSEMLSFILQRNFKFFKVNLNILDKINDICSSKSGSIYEINSDINVVKDRNNLIITSNRVFQNVEIEVQFNKVYQIGDKTYRFEKIKNSDKIVLDDNPELEYIDADNLPNKLTLRTIRDGDSFKPLGMEGRMKISDYLINNKTSIIDKKNIIVLTDKVNILWVCGHRINNDFKVKKKSDKLLKMTVKTVEIEHKTTK